MPKPEIGATGWGATLNAHLDTLQAQADLDANVAAKVGDEGTATGAALSATYAAKAHETNTANPHAVTKAQVGLGSVDNTSDADKPVSTATQTALDGKAGLAAAKNVFTGKQEINAGFTNSLDTDLWIAGPIRNNPTNDSQGVYAQHRVMGDLGGQVHSGMAAEVRATSGTNASAVCGLETTAQVGGASTNLADVRSVTSNFVIQADAGGSITNASVLRSQTIPALPAGFTIGTVYGLYVENQTVGGTNYSVYAPTGLSVFGNLTVDSVAKVKGRLDLLGVPLLVRNSSDTGTFFTIGTSGPRWNDAGLQQTTVGAAGAAAALPSAPTKYLKVQDSAGTTLVIPAYAAA